MAKINSSKLEVPKTLSLFAGINIASSFLYLTDSRVGLMGTLLINSWLLYKLHELGEQRRPCANMSVQGESFFLKWSNGLFNQKVKRQIENDQLDNAVKNICNGGAAVFDNISAKLLPSPRR